MGRIIVAVCFLIVVLVIGFTIYTIVDCIRTSYKESVKKKKKEDIWEVRRRSGEALAKSMLRSDYEDDKGKKKKKKDKKSKKNKNETPVAEPAELTEEQWFAAAYPVLSTTKAKASKSVGDVLSDSISGLHDSIARTAADAKYKKLLSHDMMLNLDKISSRIEQIRERTNDKSISKILESYCESIERSVKSYIELVQAPVRSTAIETSMNEIEEAIASVPGALDAMLASTYEQDSMSAIIEAGGLKAVVEHNKKVFSGKGDGFEVEVDVTEVAKDMFGKASE